MPDSKEQAILEAAIHEFAIKGFERTSTNQIAKMAKVSKGLVFHYYKTKEKLYEASVLYAIEITMAELDFDYKKFLYKGIAGLKKLCELELIFFRKYPKIVQLITTAFINPPKNLTDKMEKLLKDLISLAPQFAREWIQGLDLKEDVDRTVLEGVFLSHYQYYFNQAWRYFKQHPEAPFEDVKPFFDEFLAMLSMSLRGLVKDDVDLLQ